MTITSPPTNIGFGKITGRFIYDVVDGPDGDSHPDYKALQGYITFMASVSKVLDATATPVPVIIARTEIVGVLDSEGYLCTPESSPDAGDSYRWIELIATDDPDLNPTGWSWTVSYTLTANDVPVPGFLRHSIFVPEGSDQDLVNYIPADGAPPVGISQAIALALEAKEDAAEALTEASTALAEVGTFDFRISELESEATHAAGELGYAENGTSAPLVLSAAPQAIDNLVLWVPTGTRPVWFTWFTSILISVGGQGWIQTRLYEVTGGVATNKRFALKHYDTPQAPAPTDTSLLGMGRVDPAPYDRVFALYGLLSQEASSLAGSIQNFASAPSWLTAEER